MKRSAGLVTILITILAALLLSSPAEARSMKMTPNDTACKGGYEFCHGLCNAQYGAPSQGQQWEDCVNKCKTERKICDANDDIALTMGGLTSANSDIFTPTGETGGTGGSGGGGTGGSGGSGGAAGTFSLSNGGVSGGAGGSAPIL